MIKNIIPIISNLFNFRQPGFVRLSYTDIIISDKAYFLMSWELDQGNKLQIKSLNYCTYKHSGSAYIAIPAGVDRIELVIANVWRSTMKEVILLRESMETQVDFFPIPLYEAVTARSIYMPQISHTLKTPQPSDIINKLQIPVFAIHTKNLTQF